MTRNLPLVVAIALVLGAGAVRARWASRQADTRDLEAAAARLEKVPLTVGPWAGTVLPFDISEYRAAGIQGALLRSYKHQDTGQELTLMIVCGRPGQIAAHTPDVCYPAAGFGIIEDHIRVTVENPEDQPPDLFWKIRVSKKDAIVPQTLNVTYAWSSNGSWQAPEREARFVFADVPVLFKLYVIRPVPPSIASEGPQVEAETDPTVDFFKLLRPELNRALFPPPAPAKATAA